MTSQHPTPSSPSAAPAPPPTPAKPLHPRPALRLSCVVPAYNEAGHLAEFLQALHACASALTPDFEILVVNDGSRDQTREVALAQAETLGMRYLEFSRNFGKEAALSAGIDHARGNAILLIDSDFQHPLEMVAQMVDLWRSGYDMVYGVITNRAAESGLKRLGTDIFYRLMGFGSDIHIPRNAGDFRLMDRKVVQALKALPERNRFMKGLYAWVGFQTVALPFVPAERHSGESSFNLRRLGSLALLGMTSFTNLPLRFWGMAGAGLSLLAICYGLWIALETLLFGNPVGGWPTLAASVLLFSGVQLLSIGILGEYIGRIYDEVKGRPIYLLAHDEDHSPLSASPADKAP